MLDILRDYLVGATTPEVLDSITAAHATFERLEVENYEEGFVEELMLNSSVHNGDTVDAVVSLTAKLQRDILLQHAVTVVDDLNTTQLDTLIRALLDMQNHDDTNALLSVLQLDMNPNEMFAECVALVSDQTPEDVMLMLESVDRMLLLRLKEVTLVRHREPAVAGTADPKHIERIKTFRATCKHPEAGHTSGFIVALEDGLPIGLPFAFYIERIGRELEGYTDYLAAETLVLAAFASKDGYDSPRTVIRQSIDQYVSSMEKITMIDIQVNKLLLNYGGHYE